MAKRHDIGWDMLTCCIFTQIFNKHQNRGSGFVHILLTANDSIIFYFQSSKLLRLAHHVS